MSLIKKNIRDIKEKTIGMGRAEKAEYIFMADRSFH